MVGDAGDRWGPLGTAGDCDATRCMRGGRYVKPLRARVKLLDIVGIQGWGCSQVVHKAFGY
eukprot:6655209-Prymnesium_polylepis.2